MYFPSDAEHVSGNSVDASTILFVPSHFRSDENFCMSSLRFSTGFFLAFRVYRCFSRARFVVVGAKMTTA